MTVPTRTGIANLPLHCRNHIPHAQLVNDTLDIDKYVDGSRISSPDVNEY